MNAPTLARAQYLMFNEGLKRLPGTTFELHHHPAVALDLATGPCTRVWGWWALADEDLAPVPCLLWSGELGWSATAVERGAFDTAGYERAFWSHRIKLLDLALANAVGPVSSLEELESQVSIEADLGPCWAAPELAGALLWGIGQQRVARTGRRNVADDPRGLAPAAELRGTVDDELTRHDLAPDSLKNPGGQTDRGLAGLLQAVAEASVGGGRGARHLHGWRPALPRLHRSGPRQSA